MTDRPTLQLLPRVMERSREPSDDALMLLAAAGERDAFIRLVGRHERRLRGFCVVLLRDEALAHDVAQDVFLRLWDRRRQYRAQGRFRELLFAMARNACRSVHRRARFMELFGLAPSSDSAPATVSMEELVGAGEQKALLTAALLRLPEKFRIPLTLRFLEELDYPQIARVIGRTESATRSRIFYGLKALSALLPPEFSP